MKKSIRPLTLKERKKPAQLLFEGGFKNVSFQIGELILKGGVDVEQSGPGLRPGILKKTEKIQFPVIIPSSVATFKGEGNIVCSVFGRKNPVDGIYDAFLVARNMERLNSFNIELRTISDLRKAEKEDQSADRLGKGQSARQHNQVNLCGVVVGSYFEDGDNPKFHIQLRQTNNAENIIHLIYEAKNAGGQVGRVKFGTMIYVEGEYAYRNIPVPKLDEQGKTVYGPNGDIEYAVNDEGEVLKRRHPYIRISAPKEANLDFDTNFSLEDPPKWIIDMANEIESKKSRLATPIEKAATETATQSIAGLSETAEL